MLNPNDMAQMTHEQLMARIQELESKVPSGGIKVGAKGGVSLYGYGRFPITAYAETWVKILDRAEEIRSFIKANQTSLSFKSGIPELGIKPPQAA